MEKSNAYSTLQQGWKDKQGVSQERADAVAKGVANAAKAPEWVSNAYKLLAGK